MAIKKTARNLLITISDKYVSTSQTHIESAEKVEIVAVGENLILASNKKINITGK
ncbi:hypothetical protein QF042_000086 [Pedobacter sp. W3I1]|uniref:hypothetical protein n=1 Tax=Pedobacter sp. W3I1 TaxID=3042291 RepID=UPI002782F480|nr:hypothetical protein [Pedobacter sp. W3I1]MDQ0636521.1 hypothetical protein [Pedobacter sp. W3I1]